MTGQQRAARSLLDRVFGGVCGGICGALGISPWWGRAFCIAATVLSGGAAALIYLILWWVLPVNLAPGEAAPGGVGLLLLTGGIVALGGALIAARAAGLLVGPGGADLFWPGVVTVAGLALLWSQVRGRSALDA